MTKTALLRACVILAAGLASATACGGAKPPVPYPSPQPAAPATVSAPPTAPSIPAAPAAAVEPPAVAPPEPPSIPTGPLSALSIDDLNRQEALKPAFFSYDSDQLDDAAQQVLTADAALLKQYSTWAITVEGHCDERGTAEYNLALGERRSLAAKTFLISLGISEDRLKTVSYGKEFPFDPGHDETAFIKNRRAQLVVTAK